MDWNATWGKPDAQMAWQWHYSPFGENLPTTDANFYREEYADELGFAAAQNNPKAKNPVLDLRYPGQFYDASTGLHQNWMRMYDPQTARYTRPDPIGLSGGMNRYVYAGGNALWATDERGEFSYVIPAVIIVGAVIAGASHHASQQAGGMTGSHHGIPGYSGNSGMKWPSVVYNESKDLSGDNSQSDKAQKARERKEYKRVCTTPPPPTGDRCLDAKANLDRLKLCLQLRQNFSKKWFNDAEPGHIDKINQTKSSIRNAELEVQLFCKEEDC